MGMLDVEKGISSRSLHVVDPNAENLYDRPIQWKRDNMPKLVSPDFVSYSYSQYCLGLAGTYPTRTSSYRIST